MSSTRQHAGGSSWQVSGMRGGARTGEAQQHSTAVGGSSGSGIRLLPASRADRLQALRPGHAATLGGALGGEGPSLGQACAHSGGLPRDFQLPVGDLSQAPAQLTIRASACTGSAVWHKIGRHAHHAGVGAEVGAACTNYCSRKPPHLAMHTL